jgi:nitric oxide reductase subunit B
VRLTGADRHLMEKWIYIVVGLVFLTGLLGTAHHYFWIGVPGYWLPLGGFFSALEPLPFLAMALMAYSALRQMKAAPDNRAALHWALGSALMAGIGAGLLGLAHTWPAVNRWTHGTLVTPMHGHLAFYGAYGMIIIALITFALPYLTANMPAGLKRGRLSLWAFWLQVAGITGITMAFGAAGIGQVYLERILGVGYLETQQLLHVHFQMLLFAAVVFATGVVLFLWDFFMLNPRRGIVLEPKPERPLAAGVH